MYVCGLFYVITVNIVHATLIDWMVGSTYLAKGAFINLYFVCV